jgi:hypothetical protein
MDHNQEQPSSLRTLPTKYSEEYFQQRIQTLQTSIQKVVPGKNQVDSDGTFSSVLESLCSVKESLASAQILLKLLEKQRDIDPSLIDQVKQVIQKDQGSIDKLRDTGTYLGCAAVKSSGLLENLIENEDVQHDILECTVLVQAIPKKLASWCAENCHKNKALLDEFLNNVDVMKAFLQAGGPVHGNYGSALEIYDSLQAEIQKVVAGNNSRGYVSPCNGYCSATLLERLALAIALEHASPILIFKTTDEEVVDPIERFWYYVDAHLDGGLDKAFDRLSTWELRFVVDSNATNEDLAWGGQYLRAYRPDEIWTSDEHWRYARAVRTDIGYRHPDHEFNNYKDLLSAGGECGARAWFGRFICKAFGIPTWGVRQPGHAAMSRWTSTGWVICLGAGWEVSWWDDTRYAGTKNGKEVNGGQRGGLDFYEETRARCGVKDVTSYYKNVILLECLAESFGETIEEDFEKQKLWRSLAIAQRKMLARPFTNQKHAYVYDIESSAENTEPAPNPAPSCVGAFLSPALRCGMDQDDFKIRILMDGSILIPATSFISPSKPTGNVMVMNSFWGGTQLHLEHNGEVEYELPSTIKPGAYAMSLLVVNVHRNQKPILVSIDDSLSLNPFKPDCFEIIHLPRQELCVNYTMGRWEQTNSIDILLSPGGRLKLSREDPCWGLSVKEILLQPKSYNFSGD